MNRRSDLKKLGGSDDDTGTAVTIKVLHFEDDEADAELVRRCLTGARAEGFELSHASSLTEGLDLLADGNFDLVLLDLCLVDSEEQETFDTVIAEAAGARVPVVVLTGKGFEDEGPTLVRKGAQDYLVKGRFDAPQLRRALLFALERARLALKMAEEATLSEQEKEARVFERLARYNPDLGLQTDEDSHDGEPS